MITRNTDLVFAVLRIKCAQRIERGVKHITPHKLLNRTIDKMVDCKPYFKVYLNRRLIVEVERTDWLS